MAFFATGVPSESLIIPGFFTAFVPRVFFENPPEVYSAIPKKIACGNLREIPSANIETFCSENTPQVLCGSLPDIPYRHLLRDLFKIFQKFL